MVFPRADGSCTLVFDGLGDFPKVVFIELVLGVPPNEYPARSRKPDGKIGKAVDIRNAFFEFFRHGAQGIPHADVLLQRIRIIDVQRNKGWRNKHKKKKGKQDNERRNRRFLTEKGLTNKLGRTFHFLFPHLEKLLLPAENAPLCPPPKPFQRGHGTLKYSLYEIFIFFFHSDLFIHPNARIDQAVSEVNEQIP